MKLKSRGSQLFSFFVLVSLTMKETTLKTTDINILYFLTHSILSFQTNQLWWLYYPIISIKLLFIFSYYPFTS
jgi:hypothetical protein